MTESVTPQDILDAHKRIKPFIRPTPLLRADNIDPAAACQVWLKPEILQVTGAVNNRGALNATLQLPPERVARGFIASSSGNYAQGLAWAARMLGTIVTLVLT